MDQQQFKLCVRGCAGPAGCAGSVRLSSSVDPRSCPGGRAAVWRRRAAAGTAEHLRLADVHVGDRGALEPRRPGARLAFPRSDFPVRRPHRGHRRNELALCGRHVGRRLCGQVNETRRELNDSVICRVRVFGSFAPPPLKRTNDSKRDSFILVNEIQRTDTVKRSELPITNRQASTHIQLVSRLNWLNVYM